MIWQHLIKYNHHFVQKKHWDYHTALKKGLIVNVKIVAKFKLVI